MSINLVYPGTNNNFIDACGRANNILKSPDFIQMISSRTRPYDESSPRDLPPKKIAELFRDSNLVLTLQHYSRPASIGGAFDPRYPKTLWVNVNTRRTGCIYAAVLIHECVHALSYHTKEYNFSHDGDDPSENQGTAPYAIQKAVRETFCGLALEALEELDIIELSIDEKDIVETEK